MTVDGTPGGSEELRARALRRLKKKRDFYAHLMVYVLMNAFVVVVWVMTGANTFFWPVFLIVPWGIGVVMNGWDVFRGEDFTEAAVRREMQRLG
jgi:hypothetical protein